MLTAERLRELLHYDPATGLFRWLVARNSHAGKVKPGAIAGCEHQGRVVVTIDGKSYLATVSPSST